MAIFSKNNILIVSAVAGMALYFLLAHPVLMDDGIQYEGFTHSLARGVLDFKTFYGFQGLSILAVPIYWVTHSGISVILTSSILSLASIVLAYYVGKNYWESEQAGGIMVVLFLLTPYPYTTMMRGFQESALLFFILLTIWGSLQKKYWTPLPWAWGGLVKPFNLVLFPLFIRGFFSKKKIGWLVLALLIGAVYLGINYRQTGHFVTNAAIGSYSGFFNNQQIPSLTESFQPSLKTFGRAGANLLFSFRKIMVPATVIILGLCAILFNRKLFLRREIAIAMILNLFLVGSLTFSFSKYLLPITTLCSLLSVGYFLRYRWLFIILFADALLVFIAIYDYFGHVFWNSFWIYLIPLYLAGIIIFLLKKTPAVGGLQELG